MHITPTFYDKGLPIGRHIVIINTIAIVLPFIGLLAALADMYLRGFDPFFFGLFLSLYILTVLGITVGFHRLFTHRSFETGSIGQAFFAILGSMAIQGPLLKWVATHRWHHQYSDTSEDVHSPQIADGGLPARLRGAWHAHMGWFFMPDPPDLHRYVKDLSRSRMLTVISDQFALWATLGVLIPAALGFWWTGTWTGALLGFIWGGLARLCMVHHVTWSINSICHLWGSRTYETGDRSRNNWLFGLLALGEGWHNNHHAFPFSARHGLKWWQLDVSYLVIRLMSLCRMARKIKLPGSS